MLLLIIIISWTPIKWAIFEGQVRKTRVTVTWLCFPGSHNRNTEDRTVLGGTVTQTVGLEERKLNLQNGLSYCVKILLLMFSDDMNDHLLFMWNVKWINYNFRTSELLMRVSILLILILLISFPSNFLPAVNWEWGSWHTEFYQFA